jgi:thiol-disulfide isomerase/thioredoxin
MRYCFTILAVLHALFSCAQEPLSIGDTVPNTLYEEIYQQAGFSKTSNDFETRLLVLDFWATWCTSCLHGLPRADSMQAQFGSQVNIVLVNSRSTRDYASKVQAFFKKWEERTNRKLGLMSIVEDTLMEKLFPHQLIPHYVWINKGKVLAFTSSDALTAININTVLEGGTPGFVMKKEQSTDRPIFSNADLPKDKLLTYSVFIKGWFDGLPSGSRLREKENIICGMAFTNTSLLSMYKKLARDMNQNLTDKQVIVEGAPELILPDSSQDREAWYRKHAYSLELIVPVEQASHLLERMLDALNSYSGYRGQFEQKKRLCLVLVRFGQRSATSKGGETENHLWDKSERYLRNGNISLLVEYLNSLSGIKSYVLNETGYKRNIDLKLAREVFDLDSANKALQPYGMKLIKAERWMKVFVVRKK